MKKQRNSCERINQVISMPRHRFSIFIERLLHYFNLCQHQSFVSSFVPRIITINYYDQRVKRYTTMFGNHLVRDPSPIPGEVRFFFFFSISDTITVCQRRRNELTLFRRDLNGVWFGTGFPSRLPLVDGIPLSTVRNIASGAKVILNLLDKFVHPF